MLAQVVKWGNSLALRIPASLAQTLTVTEGHAVRLSIEDHRLIITPVNDPPRYTLAELLNGVTPDNVHGEAGFGAAGENELLP